LRFRRQYLVRLCPEIHAAFKFLCDRAGYKRMNIAIERIMLKCIEDGALPIPPQGSHEVELIRRFELLEKRKKLRKILGWKT